MKTKEQLNALKKEVGTQENAKVTVNELDDRQLETVSGGGFFSDIYKKVQNVGKQALNGAGMVAPSTAANHVADLLKPNQSSDD